MIGNLGVSGFPGLMEVAAVILAVIVFVAMTTYQVAYSRLIFVSGLERHLPRIFTHLNPRTRNPVTAILIQGVLSSLILVGLYSQSSMANVTIYLQGGLSVVWLISGFFFFIPLVIARKKYADRYASEDFWRIPGGMVCGLDRGRRSASVGDLRGHLLLVRLAVDRRAGMEPPWMTWVGASPSACSSSASSCTSSAAGRRTKVTKEDALAHLAVLDLNETKPRGSRPMTLDSTMPRADATDDKHQLSAGPADRRRDRGRRGHHHGFRICHADTEVRDDPAGGAGEDRRR